MYDTNNNTSINEKILSGMGYVFSRTFESTKYNSFREFRYRHTDIILRVYLYGNDIIIYKPTTDPRFLNSIPKILFDGKCKDIDTLLLLHNLLDYSQTSNTDLIDERIEDIFNIDK